ncbi:MAG TPA: pyridoxamine 5'-phosphate oxidase family protein [Thermodesulfobacteriota bacterium]|nr:pyridoxamine 5'-phosphate oxidase family protein [Thermodesulfobacteriota bacterium]
MKFKKIERDFISLQRLIRIATVDKNGTPHNVPVCHVSEGNHIYFATGKESKKIKNLEENGKVALVCDEYSEIWSYLKGVFVQGKTRVISKGPEFRKLKKMLYQKYTLYEAEAPIEEENTVIVEIIPQNIVSWGL